MNLFDLEVIRRILVQIMSRKEEIPVIDKNLYFLGSFLQEPNIQLIVERETELCPAEEIGLAYSREVNRDDSSNFEFFMQIDPAVIKILSPKEKIRLYILLRLISLKTDSKTWKYIFDDYNNLLKKRGFQSDRYLYLSQLPDSFFCYEIDCILTKGYPSRRQFYREINSRYCKNRYSLEELILRYFKITLTKASKKRPKRLIRHKGYRDRGSLGTGVGALNRDIQSDITVQEKEEQRKKQTADFLEFLFGFWS